MLTDVPELPGRAKRKTPRRKTRGRLADQRELAEHTETRRFLVGLGNPSMASTISLVSVITMRRLTRMASSITWTNGLNASWREVAVRIWRSLRHIVALTSSSESITGLGEAGG